jgi:hypothetical protein
MKMVESRHRIRWRSPMGFEDVGAGGTAIRAVVEMSCMLTPLSLVNSVSSPAVLNDRVNALPLRLH